MMKNISRQRTRLSRSASVSSRSKQWKMGIAIVVVGAILLVSVFFLQERLGGFGSKTTVMNEDMETGLDDQGWMDEKTTEEEDGDGEDGKRIKLFEKPHIRDTNAKNMEMADLEEENADFESFDKVDGKFDEDDEDDPDVEEIDVLKQGSRIQDRDEDEDEDGAEVDEADDDQERASDLDLEDRNSEEQVFKVAKDLPKAEEFRKRNETEKRLERLGQIRSVPRFTPDEIENRTKDKETVAWDKVLGIIKMPLSGKSVPRKLGIHASFSKQADEKTKLSFSSDDEPMDSSLQQGVDVEEALMLRKGKQLGSKVFITNPKPVPTKNVFDAKYARKIIKPVSDPSNPTGNSLLQDPDTVEPWGLTKSDKAISRVLRKGMGEEEELKEAEEMNENVKIVERKALGKEPIRTEEKNVNVQEKHVKTHQRKMQENTRKRAKGDNRKWGYFPGLNSMLSFSEFMEQFLNVGSTKAGSEACELNVFQAWNTPPWSYTVRHQRGLESLLHFHPHACVVVFSETVELDFFEKFVEKGYKVAVVRPQLEEFLEGTPAEIFASVWLEWRKTELYYIHYSELLRLAALYKYGGIYLDSDIILLKPLHSLRNTLGMEVLANGKTRLNGAVMAFDKSSSFIRECMEEYTATYDDKLMEFNGADLLTRVQSGRRNATWRKQREEELHILPPDAFFPINSNNITSYFYGPVNETMMQEMLQNSYTLHLWNRASASFIPEQNSLAGMTLDQHCIYCTDAI